MSHDVKFEEGRKWDWGEPSMGAATPDEHLVVVYPDELASHDAAPTASRRDE